MKHWNEESFGSECPINWEEIAATVNAHLTEYQSINECDEDELEAHSEQLWEQFCETDKICGITAEW